MSTTGRWLLALTLGCALYLLSFPISRAQTDEVCFTETDLCIAGRFREYWQQQGGLAVFGLPITAARTERVEGREFLVQWFERARFELHPENPRPDDVLLGRLGDDLLRARGVDWTTFVRSTARPGCRYFPETSHNVCGAILARWRSQGVERDGRRGFSEAENLALFGLPLSEERIERIEGREYTVQWFERGRFELHPEYTPPNDVLLGRLGAELVAIGAGTPSTSEPTPVPPQPTAVPQPPAPPTTTATQRPRDDNNDPTVTPLPPEITPVPPTQTSLPPEITPVPPTQTSLPEEDTPVPPPPTELPGRPGPRPPQP